MWELDCEEGWAPKNWCFWIVVLEKTLASPLDCKEIQPVHSKGDQPWDFFGRNDAKAEIPVLWPPHAKSWLIGKDSDAGRDWGQEEKGMREDETAGWHHWLDGHESEWSPGVGDGQGGLVCCDSWGRKKLDTTEQLIWSDVYVYVIELFLLIGECMSYYCELCAVMSHLCLTLYNPMDCNWPVSSVHRILQARILEWVALPSSRRSYRPRDQIQVFCIVSRFFITVPPGKPWVTITA